MMMCLLNTARMMTSPLLLNERNARTKLDSQPGNGGVEISLRIVLVPRFLLVRWQHVIHDWSPLFAHPNERWLMFKPCDSHLSTDESMIPYHGKHGSK